MERFRSHHFNVRPHGCMSRAAKFVARHEMLTLVQELGGECRDVTGHQHGIRIRTRHQETVNHVGTGAAKGDLGVCGDDKALRIEGVLLREQAYDNAAIAANLHTEILFDEFTRHVQRRRIDGFDT